MTKTKIGRLLNELSEKHGNNFQVFRFVKKGTDEVLRFVTLGEIVDSFNNQTTWYNTLINTSEFQFLVSCIEDGGIDIPSVVEETTDSVQENNENEEETLLN